LLSPETILTTELRVSRESHSDSAPPQPLSKSKTGRLHTTVCRSRKYVIECSRLSRCPTRRQLLFPPQSRHSGRAPSTSGLPDKLTISEPVRTSHLGQSRTSIVNVSPFAVCSRKRLGSALAVRASRLLCSRRSRPEAFAAAQRVD
jgi:hypothetical protein